MGLCGSSQNDSNDSKNILITDLDEENIVFCETLRGITLSTLRFLSTAIGNQSDQFFELACLLFRREANYMDLIAHDLFEEFFRATFQLPKKEIEVNDVAMRDPEYQQKRFEALLDIVENAPWKKPVMGKNMEQVAALQNAFKITYKNFISLVEFTDDSQKVQCETICKLLSIFIGDFQSSRELLYESIDACIGTDSKTSTGDLNNNNSNNLGMMSNTSNFYKV
eukprot:TRINITY_DN1582_c0_g1_i1.p1 TRINITY_DN1582_c0_g1~~TRINITY_DN1582_c0_g1_i1.p1  ORF type:complete len:224 (+),score=36.72 TRINITY_DN1582_c0_g1_i1:173-844(+)